MSLNFLDFEQPIAELEAKIDSLTAVSRQDEKLDINIDEEVHRLREKSVELTRKIFADLGAYGPSARQRGMKATRHSQPIRM